MPASVSGDDVRRIVLQQSKRANVGHIGSGLSVADIVAALYGGVLRGDPSDADRDRFVMCKGHAALAVYAALRLAGRLSAEQLDRYCGDGGHLGVHPNHSLAGIDFSTGSLGQGLAYAAGATLGARLQGSKRRVFALLSDAECNEGSVWESVMFAAHHQLSNLVAIIDVNGQQALGYTDGVISMQGMEQRWTAFGWDVTSIDGHDQKALTRTIAGLTGDRPHVLVANTTFGKGVSFMEGQIAWHYLPMNDEQFKLAMSEIGA